MFLSQKLRGAELYYNTLDTELIVIIEAFRAWRLYLVYIVEIVEVLIDYLNYYYLTIKTKLS